MAARDDVDPLEGADVIVRGRFENQRVAVVPMEGAAIAVIPGDDGDGHQLTVYLGCQMPHMNRGGLAGNFGLEPATVRLIAPHVGGSFGAKHWAPEDIVAVRVARRARPAGQVGRDPLGEHDRHAARPWAGAVPGARSPARRHHRRPALPGGRRRRRLRRVRRHARVRTHAHDVAGRLPHPEDRLRRRGRGSPTWRRWVRTGGPVARKRRRCSSGSSTWPRSSWASTRSSCGGATSSSPTSSRTRPSPVSPTTSATTTPRSPRRCASPGTTSCAPSRRRGVSAATPGSSASASPPTSRSRRAARAASTPRSRCTPTAARR